MTAVLGTNGPDRDGAGAAPDVPPDVPPDVAARLVRALDRSPDRVVALIDPDLTTRWLGHSARWILGQDPDERAGGNALERVRPAGP
jgi:hypothetical protein